MIPQNTIEPGTTQVEPDIPEITDQDIRYMLEKEDKETLRKYLFPSKQEIAMKKKREEQKKKLEKLIEQSNMDELSFLLGFLTDTAMEETRNNIDAGFLIEFLHQKETQSDVRMHIIGMRTWFILDEEEENEEGFFAESGVHSHHNPNRPGQ